MPFRRSFFSGEQPARCFSDVMEIWDAERSGVSKRIERRHVQSPAARSAVVSRALLASIIRRS